MSLRAFCDRCDGPATSASKTFKLDNTYEFTTIFRRLESQGDPDHVCDNCLADLLMAAVETLGDSKIVLNYRDTVRAAAERDAAREECEQLRDEKAALLTRMNRSDEARMGVEQKLAAAVELASLHEVEARKARQEADDKIRRAEAERNQKIIDEKLDPEYVDAVKRREQKRASGR